MKAAVILPIASLTLIASATAQETWSAFELRGGAEYTTGSYGADTDTDILYLPVSVSYETETFQLGATTSWLSIDGPGSVVGGDGGVVIGPGSGAATSESGLGDVILSGTWNFYPPSYDTSLPYFELTGKVKLPTADEDKGLGTGETDYSLQLDYFQSFGDFTPFATVGYKVRGEPDGFELDDSLFASVGTVYKVGEGLSVGGAYDWREASTGFAEDVSEVSPFATITLTESVKLTGYGVFGLSDGSPDAGAGVQLSREF